MGRTSLVIIGSVLWEALNHNPVALLQEVDVDNASEAWKKEAQKLLNRYLAYLKKKFRITHRCVFLYGVWPS